MLDNQELFRQALTRVEPSLNLIPLARQNAVVDIPFKVAWDKLQDYNHIIEVYPSWSVPLAHTGFSYENLINKSARQVVESMHDFCQHRKTWLVHPNEAPTIIAWLQQQNDVFHHSRYFWSYTHLIGLLIKSLMADEIIGEGFEKHALSCAKTHFLEAAEFPEFASITLQFVPDRYIFDDAFQARVFKRVMCDGSKYSGHNFMRHLYGFADMPYLYSPNLFFELINKWAEDSLGSASGFVLTKKALARPSEHLAKFYNWQLNASERDYVAELRRKLPKTSIDLALEEDISLEEAERKLSHLGFLPSKHNHKVLVPNFFHYC